MSTMCEDHHHSFFSKSALKDINLPPRKLLLNRSKHLNCEETQSPKPQMLDLEDYEDEADPYSSDEFRMYEFKIRRCMRSRSHDWTDCPFAHPGEKARRRDPRRFHYSGNPCADFRHGTCPRGESCEFAHGVFECWLHPARYRTHACKDGKVCTRKVCFFAHTPRQLRVLPLTTQSQCSSPSVSSPCCSFCNSMTNSPTSTLMGMSHLSPPMSPKLSPSPKDGGFSLLSRFNEASTLSPKSSHSTTKQQLTLSEYLCYKNALMDLMNSLENMDLTSTDSPTASWGVSGGGGGGVSPDYEDQQTQFFLSPTTSSRGSGGRARDFFNDQDGNGNGNGGPDLGWVNELVM